MPSHPKYITDPATGVLMKNPLYVNPNAPASNVPVANP